MHKKKLGGVKSGDLAAQSVTDLQSGILERNFVAETEYFDSVFSNIFLFFFRNEGCNSNLLVEHGPYMNVKRISCSLKTVFLHINIDKEAKGLSYHN